MRLVQANHCRDVEERRCAELLHTCVQLHWLQDVVAHGKHLKFLSSCQAFILSISLAKKVVHYARTVNGY